MKRQLLGLWVISVAAAAAGCGNSIDAAPNPTPTPTATPDPTPTPGDRSGVYSVAAAQPTVTCNAGAVILTFNVPNVDIFVGGGVFTPDWGFSPSATLSLPDPEHGTITGDAFTANYTYCDYSSLAAITTKHIATWTGTFNGDGSFDSTLTQVLYNATGNHVADCGIGPSDGTVTTNMTDCTSPGLSWAIHGTPQ